MENLINENFRINWFNLTVNVYVQRESGFPKVLVGVTLVDAVAHSKVDSLKII